MANFSAREQLMLELINRGRMDPNAEAKRYRMEIAGEMSKREIAEAQRQAREWLARH